MLCVMQAVPSSDDGCHYFRLQLIDECAQLVEEDVVESDRRFALLEMRQQGVSDIARVGGALAQGPYAGLMVALAVSH